MVMTPKVRRYLLGAIAWESVVITTLLIVFVNAGRRIRLLDLGLFLIVAIFGAFVAVICATVASRVRPVLSIILGFSVGVASAVTGGYLWASALTGFETPSAIYMGCLLLSIPSGIGGAIAGWINRQPSAIDLRR
jgi:hypothetical protein